MEYPSLLWKSGLLQNHTLFLTDERGKTLPAEGAVAQNVLDDLLPEGAFGAGSAVYFRFPCGREEIPARQKLIWKLAHDEGFLKTAENLLEEVSQFDRLYHRWKAPELPKSQYALLFPSVAAAYLHLAEKFAGMLPEGADDGADTGNKWGFAADVRDCFAGILAEEQVLGLRRALDGFFRSRPGGVKLSIQGGSMTAFAAASGHTETLRQIFSEMGIADAYPAPRVHRADDIVIDAYGAVYPDVLEHAGRLVTEYGVYLEEELSMADVLLYWQEMQFCREAALYTKRMEEMGYTLCLPQAAGERCIRLKDLRDVSLARREMRGENVVPNDVQMAEGDGSHFFFVTGANGGGKTTYLRSLGIAVLFFLTGCPVAARSGEIWPFARLCTHFPSAENFEDTGRFVDEVRRAEEIRKLADKDTVALFNETFSGTDEQKSEEYSRRLADDMYAYGTFGLYVTHIHTLTHGKIPTLAAEVDEEDENRRTYRIRRMDGTDSSFAEDILKKYRLTEEGLAERLTRMRAVRENLDDGGKGEGI